MNTTRRLRAGAALVAAFALVAAACGGDDPAPVTQPSPTEQPPPPANGEDDALEELIAAAQAEGSLTIYSGQDDVTNANTAEAFRARYDIDIDIPRVRSGDQAQRVPAEAQAGAMVADAVITTDEAFLKQGYADGLFADMTEEEIPSLADFPADFFYDGFRVIFSVNMIKVTYNESLIPAELVPSEWSDLLDPELQDRVIMVDPRTSATWRVVMYMLDQSQGPDFLVQLREQNPRFYESAPPASEALAAGEGWVALPNIDSVIAPLVEAGAPLANVELNPTTGVEQNYAITADAPNPNAARLFAHWLLTPEGQKAFNADDKGSPLGEEGGLVIPADYIVVDKAAAEAAWPELMPKLGLS